MKRAYNDKLSEKVNKQLSRRYRTVQMQKRMIAIISILIISAVILLSTSIHAFAESQSEKKTYYKYYTSVCVEAGDTVWSIADEYLEGSSQTKRAYVDEICQLNGLTDGQIHAGDSIVVAYYSTECK